MLVSAERYKLKEKSPFVTFLRGSIAGHFQLFSQSTERIDTKEMVYKMILTGSKKQTYGFYGVKYIHSDYFGETGLQDTTTLYVTIYEGRKFSGKSLGNAKLFITAPNFAKQLATMEITNTKSKAEKLKWTSRFGSFFAKTLWDVYSPVCSKETAFDPDAPPRKKRPLRLNGHVPQVYKCVTQDEVWNCEFWLCLSFMPLAYYSLYIHFYAGRRLLQGFE